jgi:molybdate transport system permease protein
VSVVAARGAGRAGFGSLALRFAVGLALALFLALVGLPLLALVVRVPPAELVRRLADPLVLAALRLSLVTSVTATVVVVVLGLPVAYLLATRDFRGKRVLEVCLDLPMVLPPTVAGLALLLAFGRAGLLGGALGALGVSVPFTTAAVVIAQAFMAAPFFVAPARAALAGVDDRYLDAARTLRASEAHRFLRVMLPLAAPSLVAGAAMACARALGEFGATITFAGNLPGRTETMPLAVYVALESDLSAAVALSLLLVLTSIGLLLALRRGGHGFFTSRAPVRRRAAP